MAYRILLVEDEEKLRDVIKLNLELEGYQVRTAADGAVGLEAFHAGRFDLLILDVMLPYMDGFTLCQTIRLENDQVPVLFLTAKNTSQDRVQGLKIGGDDYLSKPFNLEEFLLRVEKLIQRAQALSARETKIQEFAFGACRVNFGSFEITTQAGEQKVISKREIMLLKLMIERKNEVVSRELILETVWGYDVYPSTRTIDNYILSFRKYFELNPKQPKHFFSVRGVGYKFIP